MKHAFRRPIPLYFLCIVLRSVERETGVSGADITNLRVRSAGVVAARRMVWVAMRRAGFSVRRISLACNASTKSIQIALVAAGTRKGGGALPVNIGEWAQSLAHTLAHESRNTMASRLGVSTRTIARWRKRDALSAALLATRANIRAQRQLARERGAA